MNKNAVYTSLIAMMMLAFIVGGVIVIVRPEGFLTFASFVGTSLVAITGFAVTLYGLTKTNEKIEKVERQTNGSLSSRDERIRQLEQVLYHNGINPHTDNEIEVKNESH